MDFEKLKNSTKGQLILSVINTDEIRAIVQECIRDELEIFFNNSKDPPKSEFITRNETASILGISLPTLSAWTKVGTVPAYRIGSRVRYKRNEVEDSLKKSNQLNLKLR
ncbi:MAG: helix-turn-helix domain-containing protein [Sphingobacteriales bacterium JAD_PAG50586_3]|nr:MAG: helix-turn-helix domain-containing protein [Sphingobacteriales bacterium JAD_PAG50586_3]